MELSIVICLYNEALNIKPLISKISESLSGFDYEVVLVDDGSTDSTVQEIKSIPDPHIKLVELRRNYGQSTALSAGIDQAKGRFIVTMDGDLQNDPADIPNLMEKALKEDWDVIAGVRLNRQDNVFIRKIPSKIANYFIRNLTGVKLKDYGCTLKIFKSTIAKELGLYGELHRFIPVLASLEGATLTEMNVKHHPRIYGKSKYGINRTFKVIVDLIFLLFVKKFLQKPMHLFGTLGLLILLSGVVLDAVLFVQKIIGLDIWGRPLLILATILTLGGIQIITFGIITELLMRTYYESQDKKTYRIKKISFQGAIKSQHPVNLIPTN